MMTETYSKKKYRAFLRQELIEYEALISDMTEQELHDLREWVSEGNRVVDNPYCCHEEEGWPMDYISAVRFNECLLAHFEQFGFPSYAKEKITADGDDDAPF